jgi:molybdopterin-biosynthesis enzyme MoeA-like protein
VDIKLMLDEDVHLALADGLEKRGYDVVHVVTLGRRSKSDAEQLEYAATHGRCVFTFNVGDFGDLHELWLNDQREHAGIIVSKHRTVGECLRRLLVVLQTTGAEQMYNQIRFL